MARYAKRTMARKKKRYGYRKKRRSPDTYIPRKMSNMNMLVRQKFMCAVAVATLPGANDVVSLAYSFPINYPGMFRDNDNAYKHLPDLPTNFNIFFNSSNAVYDQYKVLSLKVVWIPNAPAVLDMNLGYEAGDASTIGVQRTLYWTIDHNDNFNINQGEDAYNAGVIPKFTNHKQRIIYKNQRIFKNTWFDPLEYNRNPETDPNTNDQVLPVNSYGSIKLFFNNLHQIPTYMNYVGQVYVFWDVVFKGVSYPAP